MPIAKELALKILGALAVGGSVIGGGIALGRSMKGTPKGTDVKDSGGKEEENKPKDQEDNTHVQDQKGDGGDLSVSEVKDTPPKKDPETSEILENLGLSCGTDNICTLITGKKLSVKQDKKSETLTSLTSAGTEYENGRTRGKIRLLETGDQEKKKISFTIEDGNIWPTWEGRSSKITKLEEFETYEIEEETVADGQKKYHFKRKTKAHDEMARLLGLSGNDCKLPAGGDNNSTKTCTLDLAKLKAINFEGKKESEDPTIGDSETVTLTINKLDINVDEDNYFKYPFGYQFILSGDKEVKIPASPNEIVKKAKDSLGFKIKITPETGGPKTLTLEKVSQLERLAGSLGFTECKEVGGVKTCKFPKTINVYKDAKNSISGGKIKNENQTITYEENAEDFEGEIKFTVSSDISIDPGRINGTFSKIAAGDYEAKQQTVDSQTLWYLSKK